VAPRGKAVPENINNPPKTTTQHFTCDECGKSLGGTSFVKRLGRPYCKECLELIKQRELERTKHMCDRCKKPIADPNEMLIIKKQKFHAFHFSCTACKKDLTPDCEELDGKLYCRPCHSSGICFVFLPCSNSCLTWTTEKPSLQPVPSVAAPLTDAVSMLLEKCTIQSTLCAQNARSRLRVVTTTRSTATPIAKSTLTSKKATIAHAVESLRAAEVFFFFPSNFLKLWTSDYLSSPVVAVNGRSFCEKHFTCIGCEVDLSAAMKGKFFDWDTKAMCKDCYNKLPSKLQAKLSRYADLERKFTTSLAK